MLIIPRALVTHSLLQLGLCFLLFCVHYLVLSIEKYYGVCRFELVYFPLHAWTLAVVQYMAPLVIMGGIYYQILKTIKKKVSNLYMWLIRVKMDLWCK